MGVRKMDLAPKGSKDTQFSIPSKLFLLFYLRGQSFWATSIYRWCKSTGVTCKNTCKIPKILMHFGGRINSLATKTVNEWLLCQPPWHLHSPSGPNPWTELEQVKTGDWSFYKPNMSIHRLHNTYHGVYIYAYMYWYCTTNKSII